MFSGVFLRAVAGLSMTAFIALLFGSSDVRDIGPRGGFPDDAASGRQGIAMTPAALENDAVGGSERILIDAALLARTSDLLWEGSIRLGTRSDDTLANASLAANAIGYTILHPNEIFSFNDIVGARSEAKGYKPGLMYSQGDLVTGIGGGICLVSTLLYNAVLETGLKIIERHPHSGPVSYADPGRDAAVSFGWADLRFMNNTGDLLLVEARTVDGELKVVLYGKKQPDRSVEIVAEDFEELPYKIMEKEDPVIPEGELVVEREARSGFAVTIVRLIRQNKKLVSREIVSRDTILPRDKIILIPPKELPVTMLDISPSPMPVGEPESAPRPVPVPAPSIVTPEEPAVQPSLVETPGRSLPTIDRTTSTAPE